MKTEKLKIKENQNRKIWKKGKIMKTEKFENKKEKIMKSKKLEKQGKIMKTKN